MSGDLARDLQRIQRKQKRALVVNGPHPHHPTSTQQYQTNAANISSADDERSYSLNSATDCDRENIHKHQYEIHSKNQYEARNENKKVPASSQAIKESEYYGEEENWNDFPYYQQDEQYYPEESDWDWKEDDSRC